MGIGPIGRPSRQENVRYYHAAKKCLTTRFPYFSVDYVGIPSEKYITSEFSNWADAGIKPETAFLAMKEHFNHLYCLPRGEDRSVDQTECESITYNRHQARKNARVQPAFSVSFTSNWLRKWLQFFIVNQSKRD